MSSAARAAVERCLAAVDRYEDDVRAWVVIDPDADTDVDGPLAGLTLGVKDVFDTASFPSERGSPIYRGFRPGADAAAVALLARAGAVVLGKTVTAELAITHPGVTRNPHRLDHTPGGSSSGSAAAVATGMADLALGTQTAGSVIRPASFCGVFGFKPTFGTVSVAGVKLVAPTLDTVGWFARDVNVLDAARVALTGRPPCAEATPSFALVRTDQWDEADEDTREVVLRAAEAARSAGATVVARDLPDAAAGLAGEQPIVMAYEAARSLAWEHSERRDHLSPALVRLLDWGASIDPVEYDRVRARSAPPFEEVLLTPAVVGEAPKGLESTGDPRFCRLWTLLGWPAVSVPGLTGRTGLPIGVQLVGPPGGDAIVLSAAKWLARALR